jgi:hypothetical protein
MLSYQRSASRVFAVLCTVTFVVLAGLGVGCSSDDIVGDATAEAVEAGLDDVLAKTVTPINSFFGKIPDIVGGVAGRGLGLACPANPSDACDGGGTSSCAVTGGGTTRTFTFDQCNVVSGDTPFTLDGEMVETPGDPTTNLQFNNLFIEDNSPAINGQGSVNTANCSYTVQVGTTDDTSVNGAINFPCPHNDEYPLNTSTLTITLDDGDVTLIFSFDGSNFAHAVASQGKTEVADCTINMATDPLSSSCEAP